jgi:hypothetical protein
MGYEPSLDELQREAGYHRDRLALYKARVLTGRPSTQTRLRELERSAASAKARLDRAVARSQFDAPPDSPRRRP